MNKIVIHFATGNGHKVKEAKMVLEPFNIDLTWKKTVLEEIQSDSLEEIAIHSLKRGNFGPWTIVEDTGLFIEELNGFPGPYSSYVVKTLGNEGILKLLRESTSRKAYFKSIIALLLPNKEIKMFEGKTLGVIAREIRSPETGWGFDPIFIPDEGNGKTYSEMGKEKNEISHRAKAFKNLGLWLKNEFNNRNRT